MKRIIKNDIFIRAIKTFIQGFLGAFIVFLNSNTSFDEKAFKSAFIGALSGGISALMNYIIKLLDKGGE